LVLIVVNAIVNIYFNPFALINKQMNFLLLKEPSNLNGRFFSHSKVEDVPSKLHLELILSYGMKWALKATSH
jgi:hypothetical protein